MSRSVRIEGPARVKGSLNLPGDKSISHRIALLASLARGSSGITGLASSADCEATLECIRRLGITSERDGPELLIHGRGLFGYRPDGDRVHLDAGNSGSTIRIISGILAGQSFASRIDGDQSLRRRPMARVIEPLALMGAHIAGTNGSFAPLTIEGRKLKAITYTSPIASAQVKTCVLFAGLLAEGRTTFTEPAVSRNHTELMLKEFGAQTSGEATGSVSVEGLHELRPVSYQVPGDPSSAAFFAAAAAVLPDSEVLIRDLSLNPTRIAFIDVLADLGANVEKQNVRRQHGEIVGDLLVSSRQPESTAREMRLSGAIIPNLIDEIPMLAVVGTQVEGRLEVRGAAELRIKESDRIRTIVNGVRALGGKIEEFEDGFAVNGPQQLLGGVVDTSRDHRIAMAFSIAGLIASGTTEILDADSAGVSFPGFYESLAELTEGGAVRRGDC